MTQLRRAPRLSALPGWTVSDLKPPERIYLRERTSGGGYPTGILSCEWETEKIRGDFAYVREDVARATEDQLAKDLGEAVSMLDAAYGYTTAATDLLPERIKAFLARIAQEKKP